VEERRPGVISRFLNGLRAAPEDGQRPDQELLTQFLAHADEQAFAQLVRRHGSLVLSAARAIVGNVVDADDVFQATFMVLARRAASIRNQASLSSWLHGVARRLAMKLRRSLSRRRGHEARAVVPAEAQPMNDVTLQERDRLLHEELGQLPGKYRLPVLLCYWEDLTHEQAATQLGWSKWTFKDRLERGRELLRQRLERRGVTLGVAGLLGAFAEARAAAVVPAELAATTVKTALMFAAGQTAAGIASASALSLAKKGLLVMWWTNLKIAAVVAVALIVAGGTLAFQARGPSESDGVSQPRSPGAPAGKELRAVKTTDLGKGPLQDKVKDGWRNVLIGKHQTPVRGAVLGPKGKRLFTIGERNDLLKVWNLETLKLEKAFQLDMSATLCLALAPDGKSLLVSLFEPDKDVALLVVDAETLREIERLPVKKDLPILGLAFSSDGKKLAIATNTITVWDWKARKQLAELRPAEKTAGIRKVAFTPDGTHVVANCPSTTNVDDGTTFVWDLETKKEVAAHDAGSQLLDFAVLSDKEIVLSTRKVIKVWQWREDKVRSIFKAGLEALGDAGPRELQCGSLATADGKRLVSAVIQGQPAPKGARPKHLTQVRILDGATGKVLHRFATSDSIFDCWRVGPGGKSILCTQWDGSVWLLSQEAKADN
jgi:RNA polymerase sigma factor (sigma-70 family)